MNGTITLYRADTTGNAQNCLYRHEVFAETPQQLAEAVRFDHVFAKFSGNRRSNKNFEYADLLVLDCDNDHSDCPDDWIRPEDLEGFLPDVAYAVYSSRHSDLPKGNRTPRPRFHVIFPMEHLTDAGEYAALKQKVSDLLPFFDRNALDAGRFFFGVENAKVLFHKGDRIINGWLQGEQEEAPGRSGRVIPEGSRNRTLYRIAVKTLKRFGENPDSYGLFCRENEACSPPLSVSELEKIWQSACKFYRILRSQPGYVPPEEFERAASSGDICAVEWEEPLPLEGPPLPEFPLEALPKTIADFVSAVSVSLQVPVAMAGVCALGALSVSLQKKFAVRVNDDWVEPINLYLLVSAKPSERKSACIREMTAPVREFEKNWNREHKIEIQTSQRMKSAFIRRVETLEKKVADGKADEDELEEAVRREQEYQPKEHLRLFLDDVTPEKLTSTMAANGGVCAIMSAEGGIFETFAGRYSGSANFDVVLKAFSGDSIRVDRATRPSETIENPALTLLLMLQPEVLAEIMANRAFRGKGLTARILFCLPESKAGHRLPDPPTVPEEIRREYEALLFRLLSIETERTEEIRLSPEAVEVRCSFSKVIEEKLLTELNDMDDWAGKIVGTTLRIAALICLTEAIPCGSVHSGRPAELPHCEITKDQMFRAMALAAYFVEHARAAYSCREADDILKRCRKVLDVICEKQLMQTSLRRLMRMCSFLHKSEEAQAVLDRLEEYGYLAVKDPEKRHRTGRPGNPVYAVNPRLYSEKPAGNT